MRNSDQETVAKTHPSLYFSLSHSRELFSFDQKWPLPCQWVQWQMDFVKGWDTNESLSNETDWFHIRWQYIHYYPCQFSCQRFQWQPSYHFRMFYSDIGNFSRLRDIFAISHRKWLIKYYMTHRTFPKIKILQKFIDGFRWQKFSLKFEIWALNQSLR